MSITLTHVAGPLRGQTQTFDDSRERIVIGRDASQCDVVYPADLTIVGREHCALVRKVSGDYAIDLFGQHYVAVDGEPAEPDAAVVSGRAITLGANDGPRLLVVIDRAETLGLAVTRPQQQVRSARATARRAGLVAASGAALALVVGGGLLWEGRQISDEKTRSLAMIGQMAALASKQKAAAAQQIPPDARQHLAQAVYAVVLRDSSGAEDVLGTAWAVAPGTLATNAHVAIEFQKMKPGGSMVVRPSGLGKDGLVVTSIALHPGYAAFDHVVSDDTLLVKDYSGWQDVKTIGGYDVALLKVDGTVPDSAILQIADDAELATLQPGSPLAFAGYPYENVAGDSVQSLGRTSIVQVGNMTAATDYFLLPAAFDQRHLVVHNLPSAGGASGSPIIDARNHVVALLSAGNINLVKNMRIPSAVQINYGQRVDVLRDLLDGHAGDRLRTDEPYWRKQTAAFARGADVIIADVLANVKPDATSKPVLAGSGDFQLGPDARFTRADADGKPQTIRYKMMALDLAPGSRHFVIAYGKGRSPIAAISLIQDGKIVTRNEGRGEAWAALSFTAPGAGANMAIMIEAADADIDLVIRDYLWEASST